MKNKFFIFSIVLSFLFLLSLSFVSATWDSNLDNNLIHYWNFDTINGTKLIDSMGRSNGTMQNGNPYTIQGKINNAYYFTKEDDKGISFPNDYIRFLSNDFSVSFWINETSTDSYGEILTNTNNGGGGWGINSEDDNGNGFVLRLTKSGISTCSVITNTILYGVWNHIVLTTNSTDWVKIYVNGVESFSEQSSCGFSTGYAYGFIGINTGDLGITGSLDEMAIFDKTLSDEEVENLYNNGDGVSYSNAPLNDTTYPLFSNYIDNSNTFNNTGTANFTVTVLNTNGTVFFELEETPYVATHLSGNVYNFQTTLTSGTYDYSWEAYGSGTDHLLNESEARSFFVGTDTSYPKFSNYVDNSNTFNDSGIANFTIDVLNSNGTVIINLDGVDYNMNNIGGNTYNFEAILTSGTYNYYYKSYGDGVSHLFNQSETKPFIVGSTIIIIPPTPQPSLSGNAIFDVMNSAGSGLGILLTLLSQSLPLLLIGLTMVGVIVAVGVAIANLFKHGNIFKFK